MQALAQGEQALHLLLPELSDDRNLHFNKSLRGNTLIVGRSAPGSLRLS